MRFTVKDTSAAFLAAMEERAKNVDFAAVVALTRTAGKVKDAQVELMRERLDRPTRWTLNSLQLRPATKDKLEATVETRQGFGSVPAGRYLTPLVEGGQRRMKSSEKQLGAYITPAKGAPLDPYGNVRGSTMNKVLSQLKVRNDAAQNATGSRRSKAKRKSEAFFLNGRVIYQRKGNAKPTPFLILVGKVPTYRPLLPWYRTAEEVVDQTLAAEYFKALEQFSN